MSAKSDFPPASGDSHHSVPASSKVASPRRRGKDKEPRHVPLSPLPEYPAAADSRGFAVMWCDGQRYYLGKHGTQESFNRFAEVFQQIIAARSALELVRSGQYTPTIKELVFHFLIYANDRYVKDGEHTSELSIVNWVCKGLVDRFGDILVDDFTPLHLIEIRDEWKERVVRSSVTKAMTRIRAMFKFGAARLMVKPETHAKLMAVEGLRKHQGFDNDPVEPVSDEVLEKTIPKLKPVVRAIIELQRLTGMRPGEAVSLHVGDLEKLDSGVYVFSPDGHKTEHHGRIRKVAIGPKAVEAIRMWLVEAALRYAASGKVQDGFVFVAGRSRKAKQRGHCTVEWYRKQIHKACDKAKIERWSPNQLRHTAGTEIRKEFGLEVARTVLGHSSMVTTEIYAEKDLKVAIEAMARVG